MDIAAKIAGNIADSEILPSILLVMSIQVIYLRQDQVTLYSHSDDIKPPLLPCPHPPLLDYPSPGRVSRAITSSSDGLRHYKFPPNICRW